MNKNKQKQSKEQEANSEVEKTFYQALRQAAQRALVAVMDEEVDILCGVAYDRTQGSVFRRAGSEHGRAYYNGESHSVIRPRVRKMGVHGREEEAQLQSYQMARRQQNLFAEIMKMAEGGMSLRGIKRMGRKGVSASTAQKAWVEESAKAVVTLRDRDLSQYEFYALMLDGVVLCREVVVIVAVGFCTDGTKMVLDFVRGHSESYELSRELMGRLVKRGFRNITEKLYAVIDGSDALNKALREHFPTVELLFLFTQTEGNHPQFVSN